MIEAILAVILSVATLVLVQRYNKDILLTAILFFMPFIYVGFALYGDSADVAYQELIWAIPICAIAVISLFPIANWVIYLFVAGWFLHGTYDLTHSLLFTNKGIPEWYPILCGVYDYTTGLYILYMAKRKPIGVYAFHQAKTDCECTPCACKDSDTCGCDKGVACSCHA